MGMARFTCGGSPSLSDATPMTSPAVLTTALPPHAGLDGDTMKARSSMYSQKLEKRLTACTEPVTWTRSLSSSTPTVPVSIPLVTSRDSPSRAAGHGPSPVSFTTPSPLSRRSEEHTSELQSRLHLVCRLL